MKTNGARFLESLGIPFKLLEYEVDPEDLSAITVAKKIGMPPQQVFKTLLTTGVPADRSSSAGWPTDGHGSYAFAVIPGDAELDFKKLARAAGLRKAEMTPLKDVQPLTGYIRGGVTIFGAKKAYPVYVDETLILFDKISVSAGTRGTQAVLTPDDYLRAAHALGVSVETSDLTKDPGAPSSPIRPEESAIAIPEYLYPGAATLKSTRPPGSGDPAQHQERPQQLRNCRKVGGHVHPPKHPRGGTA